MKKLKLLKYALLLLLLGIQLDLLKKRLDMRINRQIFKNYLLSDKKTVAVSKKFEKKASVWKRIEKKYKILCNEFFNV